MNAGHKKSEWRQMLVATRFLTKEFVTNSILTSPLMANEVFRHFPVEFKRFYVLFPKRNLNSNKWAPMTGKKVQALCVKVPIFVLFRVLLSQAILIALRKEKFKLLSFLKFNVKMYFKIESQISIKNRTISTPKLVGSSVALHFPSICSNFSAL